MRQIGEILSTQRPLVLPPTASVQEACRQMRDRRLGAVLVCDGGGLRGIFTGRDAVCRVLAEGRDPARVRLGEVMTCDPCTTQDKDLAIEALRVMQDRGFRHLPILHEGKVAGVVAHGDFRATERERLEQETQIWERI